MSKCHIDVKPKLIKEISEGIIEKNQDSVLVLPAIGGITTYSPNKKRRCHKLVFEVLIPDIGINGKEALSDFGGFVVLRIPTKRISPQYLDGEPNAK